MRESMKGGKNEWGEEWMNEVMDYNDNDADYGL